MSDPTNKVPFFLAGDGAYLRFRTMDFVALREKYGKPEVVSVERQRANGEPYKAEVWQTFTDRLITLVELLDPVAIVDCLRHGLKQEDGVKPYPAISFDDLPFGFSDAVEPIKDAVVLAITGKDYASLLRDRKPEAAGGRDGPFEDESPTNSSTASSEPDTAPAS